MKLIETRKDYEDVYFVDPETNPGAKHWRVYFDDKSINELLMKTKNAVAKAYELSATMENAPTESSREEAAQAVAKFHKRIICAFIGLDGYEEMLRLMSDDDNPIDPANHLIMIGDVMASFLDLLLNRASSKQLRQTGYAYRKDTRQGRRNFSKQRRNK